MTARKPAHLLRPRAGSDPELFWSRVDRSGGPDACWPWLGQLNAQGYGLVRWAIDGRAGQYRAHRVAFSLVNGCLPDPKLLPALRHSCDNRPCCNAAHLEPGTHAQNVADAAERGRMPKGEAQWQAKLTAEDVREIRALYQPYSRGEFSQLALGRRFGVHQTTISEIITGKTWSHV